MQSCISLLVLCIKCLQTLSNWKQNIMEMNGKYTMQHKDNLHLYRDHNHKGGCILCARVKVSGSWEPFGSRNFEMADTVPAEVALGISTKSFNFAGIHYIFCVYWPLVFRSGSWFHGKLGEPGPTLHKR